MSLTSSRPATKSDMRGQMGLGLSLAFLAPLAILLTIFFLVPLLSLLQQSFTRPDWTLEHYQRLIDQPLYGRILLRTLTIALQTTLLTLVLGYPIAMLMARTRGWVALLIAACVFIPMWASVLIRSYAWIVLLQRNGLVNSFLVSTGVVERPITLLYTEGAVLVAMSHVLLPYMILPIYAVLRGLPDDFGRAARSLGAGPLRTFVHVTLPLSLPGLLAGVLIVFVLALGFYITPALVGGPRTLMISTLISQQVTEFHNWPFAGAIASVLLFTTLGLTVVFRKLLRQDFTRHG